MLRRAFSLILLVWALGFAWFALVLPQPLGGQRSDTAVVLTGGEGRIARGLQALRAGWTEQLFVAGVDPEVRPAEFAAEYRVAPRLMTCCITLDKQSVDTRSNAREAARWLAERNARSVRLVTSDWHMRRAAYELGRATNDTAIARDPVRTKPSLKILFLEYNKLLARRMGDVVGL